MRLISLGGDNAALEEQMKMQLAQAEAIRPQAPRMRGNSRIQMAPGIMELLGGLAQQKTYGDLQAAAMKKSGQMAGNQTTQNQAILKAIMTQQQPQAAAPVGGSGFMPPKPRGPFDLGGQ